MSNTPKDREVKKGRSSSASGKKGGQASAKASAARKKQEAAARRNSILIIILSVVVVVAIAAGIIVNLGSKEADKTKPGTETQSAQSNISVPENDNNLEENKYPAVNELIANYRKAFKDGDTELLKEVYNSDQEINADILKATTQIIEDYQNTQYFTKRGLNTGEYVVFVYDELKLADIATLAPNLSVFYVKPTETGSLYIYRGEYNAATGTFAYESAVQDYISKLYQDEDVSNLIVTVNTKMDSACAKDTDLMEFMQKVRSKTNVTTPASDQPESESESVTDTESESASESETESGTDA